MKKFQAQKRFENNKTMKKTNKKIGSFCAVFDSSTTLCEVDQFVDKFRKETDKKDEFVIDLNLSKNGHRVFLAKHRKKEFYH